MSGTRLAIVAGAVMLTALTLISATQAKPECNDIPRGVINYSACTQ